MDEITRYDSLEYAVFKDDFEDLRKAIGAEVPISVGCRCNLWPGLEKTYIAQSCLFERKLTNEDVISLTKIMLTKNVAVYTFS